MIDDRATMTFDIRRITLFALGLLLTTSGSNLLVAQSLESAFFGGIGVGLAAHDNEPFANRLASWSPPGDQNRPRVYRTSAVPNTGLTLNAGAGFLVGPGLVIGASGEMLFFGSFDAVTTDDDRGTYTLSGGGGGLDLGYAVVNDDATIVWPYLSVGYYGYSLDFENNTGSPTPFFEGDPVPAGATQTYTGAAIRPGLGVALTRFIGGASSDGDPSGLVLQARLGWGIFPSHPSWEVDGTPVTNGGHTPCYSGVGLSITIGGGTGAF